jgi:hypothetical protein
MQNNATVWGCVLATCAPFLAAAQAAKRETPQTHPQLTYKSACADYKPYRDAPPTDWRELNDQVAGGSGGASDHAGHRMGGMKGMDMTPKPALPANAAMPVKTSPMHQGHAKQGGTP